MKHRYTIDRVFNNVVIHRAEGGRKEVKVVTLLAERGSADHDELGRVLCWALDDLAQRDASLPGFEVVGITLDIVPPAV